MRRYVLTSILTAALLVPVAVSAQPPAGQIGYGTSWAILIGIDNYRHAGRLTYALNDVRAIEATLRKVGFDRVIRLENEQATASAIRHLLGDELPTRVKADDRVVVFFAGHGVTRQIGGDKELGYLLPVDADPRALHSTAISMRELGDFADLIGARHVLFLMDACFGGLAFPRAGPAPAPRLPGYVAELVRKPVKQMITAGGKDEQVIEEGGHGLFTRFLVRALEHGDADDGDGVITATQLGYYLQKRVGEASARFGKSHTPLYGRLAGDGDLVFIRAGSPAIVPGAGPGPVVTHERRYATLVVRTPGEGFEVFLDRRSVGRAIPGQAMIIDRVVPGPHEVSARAEGFRPWRQSVELRDNQRLEILVDAVARNVARFPMPVMWHPTRDAGRHAAAAIEVLDVAGEVEHLAKGETTWRTLSPGTVLAAGDEVRTRDDAAAHLSVKRAGVLLLAENSRIRVEKSQLGETWSDVSLKLVVGQMSAGVRPGPQGGMWSRSSRNFVVTTPKGKLDIGSQHAHVVVQFDPALEQTLVGVRAWLLDKAASATYSDFKSRPVVIQDGEILTHTREASPGVTKLDDGGEALAVLLRRLSSAENAQTVNAPELTR